MAGASRNIAIGVGGLALLLAVLLGLLFGAGGAQATAQEQAAAGSFLGVASCGGTTCHGRSVANTPDMGVVRQDEILIWQDPASAAGAHSRAFAVLQEQRSRQIAQRLGIGEASSAPECLGCHATPAPPSARGPRFLRSDGVGCEGCHGPASGWLSYHYSVGATHAGNVQRGMKALDVPRARAQVCLDCHFGHPGENRFVTHRLMAAGHPRISFELDLFSTLQAHHDEDEDYRQRKGPLASNVQMWAIGQAMALDRSLTLFTDSRHAREGMFPEFFFLDCHSCHRPIQDSPEFNQTVVDNPSRPLPPGVPPYNDENMIMLSAAARVIDPAAGRRFDASSRAFHASLAGSGNRSGSSAAVRSAAQRLRQDAMAIAAAFERNPISNAQVFRIIDTITGQAISERFTDYAGSVQAVMAADTLLSALVANGAVSQEQVQGIRADINAAYQAVQDPNAYRPRDFRLSLGRAAAAIRRLR
jgi:hypothetical protein